LSVFFVPAGHGPYTAVHGPMTALRSFRNKLQLVLAIELASLRWTIGGFALVLAGSTQAVSARPFLVQSLPPEFSAVLRC